ncbi:MAG: DUF6089 family protein [Microscillaceae bacterium]|nr:DUF6089 family protein [Microscillaceae bacterium]MDW8460362.1 DUF6089 family protein [Cytophagales bacterium]
MKKITLSLLLPSLALLLSMHLQAQRRDIGYYAVGVQLNAINYFGDLNPLTQYVSTDISATRPNIGLHLIRKLSPRVHVQANLNWGRITASDFKAADINHERHRFRHIRNAHFRNDIIELAGTINVDFFPSGGQYYRRKKWTPYAEIGIGMIHHNPKARTPQAFGGDWVNLQPLGTEGQGRPGYARRYSLFTPVVPLGAGIRWKLDDRWDLSFEAVFRYTFTDYLDDVSGNYADPDDLGDPLVIAMANRTLEPTGGVRFGTRDVDRITQTINPLVNIIGSQGNVYETVSGFGAKGDKRGDPGQRDIYLVTGFHLTYIVNVGLRCPRFK